MPFPLPPRPPRRALALALVASALARPAVAGAEPTTAVAAPLTPARCTAGPVGDAFPICFDPGNRLRVELGAEVDPDGALRPTSGVGIELRHIVETDDPSIAWRFEHVVASLRARDGLLDGTLYQGRFARHARDGRIVIPTSPPRKIFLPFDLGAEVAVGEFRWSEARAGTIGVVRTGLFVELTRSDTFRRRLTIGPVGRWDLDAHLTADEASIDAHRLAPFSLGAANLHLEARNGLTAVDLGVEAGAIWSSAEGWRGAATARGGLERVLVALHDRPVSLFVDGRYVRGEGATAMAGLRFGLVARDAAPR
jgi:hypothetical protein